LNNYSLILSIDSEVNSKMNDSSSAVAISYLITGESISFFSNIPSSPNESPVVTAPIAPYLE